MGSNIGCGQVNIPTVDNTELECDDFISSTCIEVKQLCSKIGNIQGDSLDKFIEKLCIKINKQDTEIFTLKNKVELLNKKIR